MNNSVNKIESFVLFGVLGDLSVRKLIPAWYYLERDNVLNNNLKILGVGRKDITKSQFLKKIQNALKNNVSKEHLVDDTILQLLSRFDYCCCDLQSSKNYQELSLSLKEWGRSTAYYLAISPNLFESVFDGLNFAKLLTSSCRIVVEKPIGYNLESSKIINNKLLNYFDESQIYRIDHYLGKETVQNLITLRFANSLFSSQWSSKGIDYVEITAAESVGIQDRWDYFDGMGQLRDMVQSHLLQLLCLITMEPPSNLNDQSIRAEKVKVLEALKPIEEKDIKSNFVSAQYTASENKLGYVNEEGADETSDTETFVGIKAEIKNWRWTGVPFYMRTGKRMSNKTTQIVIHFKSDGHLVFDQNTGVLKGNALIISLHPTESISLQVFTKPHGVDKHSTIRSDPMSLDFIKTQKLLDIPSGYQSLLMDILNGNQSLFLCKEEVELAWQWCDNTLDAHKKSKQELYFYKAGTNGPKEYQSLMEINGHKWYEGE